MEILFIKNLQGQLIPLDEGEAEKLKRHKVGATIRAEVSQMQNPMFHRKMLALFRLCYDVFTERADTGIEWNGILVKPSFERFRKDLVILAGFYEPVYAINGEVRLEAKSISYARCDQDEAEKIYSAVIDAALKHVYKNTKDEQWLRNTVEQLLSYC